VSLSTTIKSLQDIMRKDAGVDGDAQRIGQLGWLLFFKIYSDLELEATIEHEHYVSPIPKGLHWSEWADQDALGKDAPTGEALIDLVENQLFPRLKELDLDSMSGKTRERGALLRGVFEDAFNYMKNGTLLRQVINKLNADIDFNQSSTRHLFGDIYEQILKDLQGAGNAGEFYTPRTATQFAVQMIDPQLGETILDPACGTGGFLTHAYTHVQQQVRTPDDLELLKRSINGVEKKSLPHLLCVTNMMIHGIEVPSNVRHDNTLARPLRDYGKADQVDIILTNPPFGGKERPEVQQNFPIRTGETAFLFLQHFIKILKAGGRAGIVIKNTFLSNTDNASVSLRQKLLEECNLHTVLDCPGGTFIGAGVKTVVLFFEKGTKTRKVWYYQLDPGRNMGKTNPLNDGDLAEFIELQKTFADSPKSWSVDAAEIDAKTFDLSVKNPDGGEEVVHRSPAEILDEIAALDAECAEVLGRIAKVLGKEAAHA